MPDISDYYSGGNTIKADDIEDELTVTVSGWRKAIFDDGSVSYFLKIDNDDREFRVNRTNAKRIAAMYGKDIDNWVGKSLTLMPDIIAQGKYEGTRTIVVRIKKAKKKQPQYDEANPPPVGEEDFSDPVPF